MNVLWTQKKEVISVLHNSITEMHAKFEELEAQGWSPNTRMTFGGGGAYKQPVDEEDIKELKERFPDIVIHQSKGTYMNIGPYVIMTTHERQIEDDSEA